MTTTADGPLTLHLEDFTHVTGEKVQGWVELNVPLAQDDHIEHVRIKCAIVIYARIIVVTFGDTRTHRTAYNPAADSNGVLLLPFEFTLPDEEKMPGSFYSTGNDCRATVGYSIEVIGQRPREHVLQISRPNRRVVRALSVIPAATPKQIQTKELFVKGWSGEWKTHESEIKFGRGVARLKVGSAISQKWSSFNAFSQTPGRSPSTPRSRSHLQSRPTPAMATIDNAGKLVFPHSPMASSAVQFYLHRWTHLIPEGKVRKPEDDHELKVSAAGRESTTSVEWVPEVVREDKQKDEEDGFWHKLKF
ncbi:hypothetical protein C8R45DRAFT_1074738 [Mycena sanguinolenta]|nr:hypothetical protein C8R45DRAFT_1074738 [Mycena sanguinolenta]